MCPIRDLHGELPLVVVTTVIVCPRVASDHHGYGFENRCGGFGPLTVERDIRIPLR